MLKVGFVYFVYFVPSFLCTVILSSPVCLVYPVDLFLFVCFLSLPFCLFFSLFQSLSCHRSIPTNACSLWFLQVHRWLMFWCLFLICTLGAVGCHSFSPAGTACSYVLFCNHTPYVLVNHSHVDPYITLDDAVGLGLSYEFLQYYVVLLGL